MKLQAGKTYRRRDGGLESIVRVNFGTAYNPSRSTWHIGGSRYAGIEDESDLISEVPSSDQAFHETAEAGLSVVKSSWLPVIDTMPKNVQAFVLKRGPKGSREQEAAFWKEFRKAANAYADVQAERIQATEKQLADMTEQRDNARNGWGQLYSTIRACGCPCGTPISPSIEHELMHFAKARAKWITAQCITAAKGASHE